MKSFNDLLKLHEELLEIFLQHQYALRRLEWDVASRLLDEHEKKLLAHIRAEEELMIPVYAERCEIPKGGGVELFLGEHAKLREFVEVLKDALQQVASSKESEKLVIQLFDREAMYKRLLGHHDLREEKYLYPLLDKATTGEEREEIFKKLLQTSG